MRVYAIGDFEGREVHVRLVNYGEHPGRVHLIASEHDSKRVLFAVEAETAEVAMGVLRTRTHVRKLCEGMTFLTGEVYDNSLSSPLGEAGWRCGYNHKTATDEEMERLQADAVAKAHAAAAAFDHDAMRCHRAANWAMTPKQARQLAVARFITSTASSAYDLGLLLEFARYGGVEATGQHERTIDLLYGVINDAYVEMCGADIGDSIAQV